jgi:hypothetical protein
MIVACLSILLDRRILGGTNTMEIIRPAAWTHIMMQQPSLYTHSVEDMFASWITRPTNLITVVVVCQTNGTYDGGVLYIVVVIDGKDQIAFLSLKVALVILS